MALSPKKDTLLKAAQLVEASEMSSLKRVVSGIIEIMSDPNSSARDLKQLIEVDPPLSARVMTTVNSAFYAPRERITSIEQAVIRIGFDTLRELVLSQKICEIFNSGVKFEGYSRSGLWKHSVAVALLGKMICRREFGMRGDSAYVAGLLHEIGIIAEDQFFAEQFKNALTFARIKEISLYSAEVNAFGFTHSQLGEAILCQWNLPEELAVCVALHHDPENAPLPFIQLARILFVANHICQSMQIGYCDSAYTGRKLFEVCKNKLGLESAALDMIAQDMQEEIKKMEEQGMFQE